MITNGLIQVLSVEANNFENKLLNSQNNYDVYTHYFCYVKVENDKSYRLHPHHVTGCLFYKHWIEGNPARPSEENLPDLILSVGFSGCHWGSVITKHKITIKNMLGKETVYELVAPIIKIYGFDGVVKGKTSFSWPETGFHTVELYDFWIEDPFALKVVIEQYTPD
jgi:hypothetical protein